MKKILLFFALAFGLVLTFSSSHLIDAGGWIQNTNSHSRVASYHKHNVHSSVFYSMAVEGSSRAKGCKNTVVYGDWIGNSEFRAPSTPKNPVIFKVHFNQSCY